MAIIKEFPGTGSKLHLLCSTKQKQQRRWIYDCGRSCCALTYKDSGSIKV